MGLARQSQPIAQIQAAPRLLASRSAAGAARNSVGFSGYADTAFKILIGLSALSMPVLAGLMLSELLLHAWPSIHAFGASFLNSSDWDPVSGSFGALPFVFGTLVSSVVALIIAIPLALGAAVFSTEIAPRWMQRPLAFTTELLAAIPSVIYGLWAIFVLVPVLRIHVEPRLAERLGWTGLFAGPAYGIGMLAAGIILAIMIVPIISSITREVISVVPQQQREAALALGATRWEMVRMAVLRNARAGILGAVILGLGRALGETMAVTMVIGNRPEIARSLFAPGYTMASVIANEFTEATGDLYLSALIEIALVLFAITVLVNILARLLVWTVTRGEPVKAHA